MHDQRRLFAALTIPALSAAAFPAVIRHTVGSRIEPTVPQLHYGLTGECPEARIFTMARLDRAAA